MATLADSLVSSSARKLSMRVRPDLIARQHRYQGRVSWVVKDPVGLKYFRFQAGEYFILRLLDGDISLDEIKERFEREFPPEKITVEELQQFIGSLHRSGLILANVPGQGVQLKQRHDERQRKELLAALTNILSIRFKGIDPERILTWMDPYVSWLFRPWAVAAWFMLVLSALTLVMVQFDVFQAKLPAFHQFFNVENAWLLAVALAVTKILHEFGHGVTCKHFGGECHEMGVLVLVLTPCLYCNVSDSWMLPSKWQRAMIGAGGMYVELAIASVCTFIWWFSEPGLLNYLALSTMFVCSVSTVIFNGNPLLRYDGYYILSDIMEIPNLRQKSTDILSRKMAWWCLGIESPHDPFLPERNQLFFALYTVAAAIYRWIVTFSILWFLYKVFEPYRLEIIGQIITVMAMYGLFLQPVYKMVKFFWVPGRVDKVKKPRMYGTLAVITALVLAFVYIPLPYEVMCTLEIEPHKPEMIYVVTPGRLEEILVEPGQQVQANQTVARLKNLDLEDAIATLEGQRNQTAAELESLRDMRFPDPKTAAAQIDQVRETLESYEKQLKQRLYDRSKLTLVANRPGTVLPPPELPHPPESKSQLPGWYGSPLRERNLGALLTESTLFCEVGDPQQMKATLVIDQADIEFVHLGQDVRIQLNELPGHRLHGTLTAIASEELKQSPKQLSNKAGGELATKTDEAGVERPMSPSYQATVPLGNTDGLLRTGLRGRAKIDAGYRTLGQRAWRYLTQTFHFRL
jgi:putative peptide zinc metalloprotease protein